MNNGGTIISPFNVCALTNYDKDMYGYMRLILLRSLSISIIEDPSQRSLSRFDIEIARDALCEFSFALSELVNKLISKEMVSTNGVLM